MNKNKKNKNDIVSLEEKKEIKIINETSLLMRMPNKFFCLINEILLNNAELIVNKNNVILKLADSFYKNAPLKLKIGFDPSGKNLHVGHLVPLKILRSILISFPHTKLDIIFGTFTVQFNDPASKRASATLSLSEYISIADEWKIYLQNYFRNVINQVQFHYNHTWLNNVKLTELLGILRKIKVQDLTQKFDTSNLTLDKLLYPFLQGYDSCVLNTDIEFGGIDQLINILFGRDITKYFLGRQQECVFSKLLTDLKGNKMSKSCPMTSIKITDNIKEFYEKIMKTNDIVFFEYFNLLSSNKIQDIIISQINNFKHRFAMELINEIYNVDDFSIITSIPKIEIEKGTKIVDILSTFTLKSKLYFRNFLKLGQILLDGVATHRNCPILQDTEITYNKKKLIVTVRS